MQKSVHTAIAAAVAAIVLSATAVASDDDAGLREITYQCESGQELKVEFRETERTIRVTVGDRPTVKLLPRPSKSGFRYGDARHSLRGEGNTVNFKVGNKTPVTCTTEDPATQILEAASAR